MPSAIAAHEIVKSTVNTADDWCQNMCYSGQRSYLAPPPYSGERTRVSPRPLVYRRYMDGPNGLSARVRARTCIGGRSAFLVLLVSEVLLVEDGDRRLCAHVLCPCVHWSIYDRSFSYYSIWQHSEKYSLTRHASESRWKEPTADRITRQATARGLSMPSAPTQCHARSYITGSPSSPVSHAIKALMHRPSVEAIVAAINVRRHASRKPPARSFRVLTALPSTRISSNAARNEGCQATD